MSSLSSKFSEAKIGVFWDPEDCPIPTGLSPLSISANIKLALENMGYTGKMSIFAYSVAKQSEELDFGSANIELMYSKTRGLKGRLMFMDVMFWGVDHTNEPTNVMVISEDLSPRVNFPKGFVSLTERGHNILLAQPENNPGVVRYTATSIWLWQSLATGGSPLDGHCMRPEPVTPPTPPCSACTRRELRLTNKRKKRPTKSFLKSCKRPTKSFLKSCKSSRANPDPEDKS